MAGGYIEDLVFGGVGLSSVTRLPGVLSPMSPERTECCL